MVGFEALDILCVLEETWKAYRNIFLFKWTSLCLFSSFQAILAKLTKILDFSGIRTRIVGIEGEHAYHLTSTLDQRKFILLLPTLSYP